MMKKIKIALTGNPNSGKSTVFNAITGAKQHVANYPGVTVEKKYGELEYRDYQIMVVDLPGIYSLTAYSMEEIVARDFIIDERPDLVVDIVDASNLERNLYLTVQLMEMGVPLIIALNMVDIASSRGIIIDYRGLSRIMGVPVIPMVARSNKGMDELMDSIIEIAPKIQSWKPLIISYGMDIDDAIREIEELIKRSNIIDKKYPSRWLAIKYIEHDTQVMEVIKQDPELYAMVQRIFNRIETHLVNTLDEEPESLITDHRYGYITGITRRVMKRKIEDRLNLSDKIDRVLTNRVLGPIFMLLIIYMTYTLTFKISEVPTEWLQHFFSYLKEMVYLLVPEGVFRSLIISGVIDGVGSVFGFVPLTLAMFFAIAILEDSGYMARIAFMMDRVLRWFGLHGNSIIALIVSGGISGGCAVPGVFATRTLRDPKERIATILITPFMNCGAKLPVYAMLIGAFFARDKARVMFILTLMAWAFSLIGARILRSTILKGPSSPFVMELPPYRPPTLKGLMIHTWERTWQYLKKAGTIILGFSVIMWALMTFPGISKKELIEFRKKQEALIQNLIVDPDLSGWIRNINDIETLSQLYEEYSDYIRTRNIQGLKLIEKSRFFPLIHTAYSLEHGFPVQVDYNLKKAAQIYLRFRNEMQTLKKTQEGVKINKTFAGYLAKKMECITKPLGFDYRVNIALIGGFAAKEVILSTLGTAYSIGNVQKELPLSERLKKDPMWNRAKAMALMVFIMLYVPCMATVASIAREVSWKWALFSICFNLAFAYGIAFLTLKIGVII